MFHNRHDLLGRRWLGWKNYLLRQLMTSTCWHVKTYPQRMHSLRRMMRGSRDLVHDGRDVWLWRRVIYTRFAARQNHIMVLVGRRTHASEARIRHILRLDLLVWEHM
ncbi:hypothetical protein H113_03541 [Trichophyton rubrum MR1459]|uniref:Uncharacterized protein n=2 Tax=Trichophyton TaxID=5550 RepID=A0A080WNF7_TRIRC|nr:uncharacterized protein TERG_12196 [Trichophyton rubrum CBS 118892]EZF74868.1 hypothetical protein H105_03540 [Trichophyton soudanense CBS 452.61]EZF96272.1 hypothetical protein H113_03541 [Trichophyton rubrum MR1459]EZG07212.1 hypothetical protein H106_03330 [Trichophyton rubrum CBS 735.88]KFL61755.1 hypothetical protein TERG_12196 [Trichophyton rubrum CBS 118892]